MKPKSHIKRFQLYPLTSKPKWAPEDGCLGDTSSDDDSTYSSQYQNDANYTPRTGISQTLSRNLPKSVIHQSGTHGNIGELGISNVKVKV